MPAGPPFAKLKASIPDAITSVSIVTTLLLKSETIVHVNNSAQRVLNTHLLPWPLEKVLNSELQRVPVQMIIPLNAGVNVWLAVVRRDHQVLNLLQPSAQLTVLHHDGAETQRLVVQDLDLQDDGQDELNEVHVIRPQPYRRLMNILLLAARQPLVVTQLPQALRNRAQEDHLNLLLHDLNRRVC